MFEEADLLLVQPPSQGKVLPDPLASPAGRSEDPPSEKDEHMPGVSGSENGYGSGVSGYGSDLGPTASQDGSISPELERDGYLCWHDGDADGPPEAEIQDLVAQMVRESDGQEADIARKQGAPRF